MGRRGKLEGIPAFLKETSSGETTDKHDVHHQRKNRDKSQHKKKGVELSNRLRKSGCGGESSHEMILRGGLVARPGQTKEELGYRKGRYTDEGRGGVQIDAVPNNSTKDATEGKDYRRLGETGGNANKGDLRIQEDIKITVH